MTQPIDIDIDISGERSGERRRPLPLRGRRLQWVSSAFFWIVGLAILAGSDLQALQAGMPAMRVAGHVLVTAIAFAVPIHVALRIVDITRWPVWRRMAVVAAVTLAWGAAMQFVQAAFGLLGSFLGAEFDYVCAVGVALSIRMSLRGLRARRKLARVTQLRMQAEQRLLGMQLAPHTLFNMLNTLYAVSLTRPAELAPLVADLSSMMRELTESERRDFHSARSEWRFIEAYRRFALARASQPSTIAISIEGEASQPVPALLAATLFENAVKHGSDAEGRLDVHLDLQLLEQGFRLRVRNRLSDRVDSPPGLRAGMELVRRRLAHLFEERHRLEVSVQSSWYIVELDVWQ